MYQLSVYPVPWDENIIHIYHKANFRLVEGNVLRSIRHHAQRIRTPDK